MQTYFNTDTELNVYTHRRVLPHADGEAHTHIGVNSQTQSRSLLLLLPLLILT